MSSTPPEPGSCSAAAFQIHAAPSPSVVTAAVSVSPSRVAHSPIRGPNLFTQVTRHGLRWRSYAESMPRPCYRGTTSLYAARHVPAERIAASEWLFVEGYVFANPHTGQHAIREALKVAKANGVKVAVTCSDAFVPQMFGDAFGAALAATDLLFCNARACTRCSLQVEPLPSQLFSLTRCDLAIVPRLISNALAPGC